MITIRKANVFLYEFNGNQSHMIIDRDEQTEETLQKLGRITYHNGIVCLGRVNYRGNDIFVNPR